MAKERRRSSSGVREREIESARVNEGEEREKRTTLPLNGIHNGTLPGPLFPSLEPAAFLFLLSFLLR